MITLYDNPFSPFARKVRMVLQYKQIPYRSVDALALAERERLLAVNPRAEVPVLVDDDVVVIHSADIVAYLEDRFPSPSLLPGSPRLRAKARTWQRLADTVIDAVVHDISLWTWPTHQRSDQPPAGLIEAGVRDLERVLANLESVLDSTPNGTPDTQGFVCGELSIADFALFPHVSSMKLLGVGLDSFPRVLRWNREMRSLTVVRGDLDYVRRCAADSFASGMSPYEAEKVFWRGDRIEWLLANGFAEWLQEELTAGRAVVPRSV